MVHEAKLGLLQKITNFLLGFVLNFFIFLLVVKIFGAFLPLWLAGGVGAILSFGAALYVIKKYTNQPGKRLVGIGLLASVIIILILPIILWVTAVNLFQGVAS